MVAVWRAIRHDLEAVRERFAPSPPPAPGLYTYRFTPPGGSVRAHLRVEADGSGVLFIDVSDVIHLNSTAVQMAKWALDGLPRDRAEARLVARYGRNDARRWQADLQAFYTLIQRLAQPSQGCATCSVAHLPHTPLFSTPVRAPFKADLAITYDCNNDCPHCYNEADRLAMAPLPPDLWKEIIDRLCDAGIPHLIFTGGEATLYADLPELIHHADRAGPVCGLNSNGRRLAHRGYTDQLAAAGLNHVQITLGSHRPEAHNRMMNARSFHQTIRGIENAQAAGLHTITNTTLMKMNAGHIEQTIHFLHRIGIRTFAVNGMIYSGGGFDTGQAIAEQDLPPILMRIRDTARQLGMKFLWYTPTQYCQMSPVELELGAKRCNAGEYSVCVEPNGDVLPCQSYYVSAGNLLRDPWERIWTSELFRSFRDRESDPRRYGLPEKCWECPDLPLCGGGCRIQREAAEGMRVANPHTGSCSGCTSCGANGTQTPAGFVSIHSLVDPSQRRGSGIFAEECATAFE